MTDEAPKEIWVGFDGRDYHPVFLTEAAAKEHGWNDADGAEATKYLRADHARAALAEFYAKGGKPIEQVEAEMAPVPVSVEVAARENIVDEIEEIIAETHDLDVTDRNYAENIVGWLERHHPAALRTLAGGE